MLNRTPSVSPEVAKQYKNTHRQLRSLGIEAQELYASLFFDLILKLSSGALLSPRCISTDPDRELHTIYEFDENGVLGYYSCTPLKVTLLSVVPNPEFYRKVELVRTAKAA